MLKWLEDRHLVEWLALVVAVAGGVFNYLYTRKRTKRSDREIYIERQGQLKLLESELNDNERKRTENLAELGRKWALKRQEAQVDFVARGIDRGGMMDTALAGIDRDCANEKASVNGDFDKCKRDFEIRIEQLKEQLKLG